jgi:hypothetical protein
MQVVQQHVADDDRARVGDGRNGKVLPALKVQGRPDFVEFVAVLDKEGVVKIFPAGETGYLFIILGAALRNLLIYNKIGWKMAGFWGLKSCF